MIVNSGWRDIGRPIESKEIEDRILSIVSRKCCNCLALSGGLDSSLMLYFMLEVYEGVRAFTIGGSESHPDIKYSKYAVEKLGRTEHFIYIPSQKEIDEEEDLDRDFKGDKATRLFYKFVRKHTPKIVSGDGIDEYMCGYPGHQVAQKEITYYEYIRRLRREHLEPLDRNSMGVSVYLPYLERELLYLFGQIPTYEKVTMRERKVLMIKMAKGKIPDEIIMRDKIGFCNALATRRRS